MSNETLEKAIATGTTARGTFTSSGSGATGTVHTAQEAGNGGLLNPEQSARFLDYMFDATVIGKVARTVRMKSDTAEIDRMSVGEKLMKLATEGDNDAANNAVTFSKISLTTKKLRMDWELSPESERKLLEFFQVGLKGKNHRSLYIPLPGDTPDSKTEFKMEPVEANPQESSFNVYRKSNRDEILLAHRVPINKIGTPEGVNLAVARDADKTFKEQVCRPAQMILEKKVNKIFEEKTDALSLKFNELTLTDEDTQSKIDERYLRMQVITPNEVRIRKGMIPLDGGDDVIELKGPAKAEQTSVAGNTRQRSQDRQATTPDISGEGRSAKGDGRQVD